MKSRDGKSQREEKSRREKIREEKESEERRSEKRKSQKKEDADARKGRKVAKQCVFSNDLWLRRVEKVGSLKRRVQSHLARWEMKNCTPLWREAHFEVVEKVHAVVVRSTSASEKANSTSRSDHFWKLRCRKSARRCGAKHICKWKS